MNIQLIEIKDYYKVVISDIGTELNGTKSSQTYRFNKDAVHIVFDNDGLDITVNDGQARKQLILSFVKPCMLRINNSLLEKYQLP
jgi:hypothetical protein